MIEQYIAENPDILPWLAIALLSFLYNEIAVGLEKNKEIEVNYWYDNLMRKYYNNK